MTQDGLVKARLAKGVAICLAGGLLAACQSSNGGFNDPIEDAIGDPLVAMGLKADPNETEIDYDPRSPLVMPAQNQTQDLPPPVAASESYGAQWPSDPDVERRKQELKMRQVAAQERPRDVEYLSKPMTPDELDDWGKAYGKVNGAGMRIGPNERAPREEKKVASPAEMARSKPGAGDLPEAEPPRTSLVEPPAGYRTPAPTVDGAEEPEKKKNFFQRLWGKS